MKHEQTRPTPAKLKLPLKETVQLGLIASGAFFGVAQGGAHKVGAEVGEPIDHGARVALAATGDVIEGAAKGAVSIVTDNTPPSDAERDKLNKAMAQRHDLPSGH